MAKVHVVVQDKKDFDREQFERLKFLLIAFGVVFGVIIIAVMLFGFSQFVSTFWNPLSSINKLITFAVVGIVVFGVYFLFRGIKDSIKRKRSRSKRKRIGFLSFIGFNDNLLAWTLVFGFVAWLISKTPILEQELQIVFSPFIFLLIVGLLFALVRWIMLTLLYGNAFKVDGWFLVWAFKSSIVYFGLIYLFNYAGFAEGFLYFVLFGFLFHFITLLLRVKILGRFRKKGAGRNFLIFVLLVLVYALSILNI